MEKLTSNIATPKGGYRAAIDPQVCKPRHLDAGKTNNSCLPRWWRFDRTGFLKALPPPLAVTAVALLPASAHDQNTTRGTP